MPTRSKKPLPSVEYLRESFDYNFATGALTWRSRPRGHFTSDSNWRRWNKQFAGRAAGTLNSYGYWIVSLTFGGTKRSLLRHIVAWALETGAWPLNEIDHANGDPGDNRLFNLREASRSEQMQNQKLPKHNTSGLMGVSWHRRARKWKAQIEAAGRDHYLGLFPTPKLAYTAYLAAKQRLHPFQPVPRSG